MRSKYWVVLIGAFAFLLLGACGGGVGYYDPWYGWSVWGDVAAWDPWDPWAVTDAKTATATDFDGDGMADLLVLDDGKVSLAPGAKAAKYDEATGLPIDGVSGPCRVLPGHFDADGILDLAVFTEATGTFDVHLGTGDGTFAPALDAGRLVLGPDVVSITCSDPGDGVLGDLLVRYADGRLEVFASDGAGGFTP